MGKLVNRAMMNVSGTPGTGTITLGGAVSGYQTFASAGVSNGDVVSYIIEDGTNWEYGQGTYTSSGTTLARTTVQGSSNSGAAISASASSRVFLSALADDIATVPTPWTPVLKFNGATTGVSYSTQSGNLMTLGNGKLVIANVHIALTSKGSSTGPATITGLPSNATALAGMVIWNYHSGMSGITSPASFVAVSGSTINLYQTGAAFTAALNDPNFTNTSEFYLTIIYIAA